MYTINELIRTEMTSESVLFQTHIRYSSFANGRLKAKIYVIVFQFEDNFLSFNDLAEMLYHCIFLFLSYVPYTGMNIALTLKR